MPSPASVIARLLRHREWIAAAAGAATTFAFAPYDQWYLAPLGPAALFLLWDDASPRDAARTGFFFGAALFAAGTWWIYTAVHDFGQAPAWLAVFLLAALVAIKGAYYALLGYIVTRVAPDGSALRSMLLIPAAWTLMEWLRGWLFTGFPWLQLGYAESDTPLAALAAIGGIHLVTFATVATAGAVVTLIRRTGRARLAAIVMALAFWIAGWMIGDREWTKPVHAPIPIALLQGAIPQDEKWLKENRQATLDLYRRLNREALPARIVVWPESAIPLLAHEAEVYLEGIRRESRAQGADVLVGILRFDFASAQVRNGLLSMSRTGDGWYFKRRLVPFGEFFPVPESVRRWMRLNSLPYYDMTPGEEGQAALQAGGERLAATICYEDAYGADELGVLPVATLLVNVTNNAWFGDSSAPHQQLQMARFRAREAGRWLMRATSNGITAVIAPDGSVAARAPQFEPAVLKYTVQPRTGLTPYARTGNFPILSLCALITVVFVLTRLRTRQNA